MPQSVWARVLAVLAVIVAAGVTIDIVDNGPDHGPDKPRRSVTVKVGHAQTNAQAPDVVSTPQAADVPAAKKVGTATVPAAAVPRAAQVEDTDVARDELAPKDNEIPGKSEGQEAALRASNQATIDAQTYDTSGVLQGATAQPAHFTCLTSQHGRPRSIKEIGLAVVHVTVSPNISGTADGFGLCAFFRRVQASPTWTVDNEGNSWLNVPLGYTPWTQAFYNRSSCSIENVGDTGRPGERRAAWTDAQYREDARLFAQCMKLAGIPVRRGAVTAGGKILRTGVITHQELGAPGGGHTDPGPKYDMAKLMRLLRKYADAGTVRIERIDRLKCVKIKWWRRAGRPHGLAERNAIKRRKYLARRALVCPARGPVRGR